jgi:hypothetical protein
MIEGINIRWPDASIRGVFCDYDNFNVEVQDNDEHDHAAKTLRCLGFLGFQMVGFWDEIIVHDARVYPSHDFIAQCEHRVMNQLPSGSIERSATGNVLLEIELIDGCKLWVCAKRFVVDGRDAEL